MKLREFLEKNKLTKERFGASAGLSANVVSNGVHLRPVGLIAALKIEKATYGNVKPIDLINEKIKAEEGLT